MSGYATNRTVKALPGSSTPSRRDHLRQYLLCCVRDNIIVPTDFLSIRILDKLRATLTDDVRSVTIGLAREVGATALGIASAFVRGRANS